MIRLILIGVFFISNHSLANRHEHLTSWPLASSVIESYQNVYDEPVENITFQEIYAPNSGAEVDDKFYRTMGERSEELFSKADYEKLTSEFQNDPPAKRHEKLGRKIYNMKLGDIAGEICQGTCRQDKLKNFFKIRADAPSSRVKYIMIESLRRNLYVHAQNKGSDKYAKFLKESFSRTVEKLPASERSFIGFSVPQEFVTEELRGVEEVLRKNGTKADFYYSLPRSRLERSGGKAKQEFSEKLRDIKRLLEQGIIQGVDITGSIFEEEDGNKNYKAARRKLIQERLRDLYSTIDSSKGDGVIRLHAFEGRSRNSFYRELRMFIKDIAHGEIKSTGRTPVISFGHIANIDEKTMKFLVKASKTAEQNGVPLKFAFDFNLDSNRALQNSETQKLIKTALELHRNGFEIGLGSDGTGILGKSSSIAGQAKLLAAQGVPEDTLKEWVQNTKEAPRVSMQQELKARRTAASQAKLKADICDMDSFESLITGFIQNPGVAK